MSYTDIWTHANNADFQGKCWAALWDVCNRVLAGESGFPAAGQVAAQASDDAGYALRVLRVESRLTGQQLAQQILRNATIAGSPATADDSALQYQINANVWAELRGIG